MSILEDQGVRMFSFFGECIYSEYDLVCLFGDKYENERVTMLAQFKYNILI